ncbi:MAG: F0F1 ATP synthase subunit B [bacterium]|nr:F0F1 ATP synthase subunit B [bacterium]
MQEFITHFGIDWKLFLAQIVNFGVILIVLRKFAYKPILNMLRERREKIEQGLEMSAQAEKNLKESDEMRNRTLQQAHADALGIVNNAEVIGKEKQDQILKQTDVKVEGIITDARRVINAERTNMRDEVYHDAQDLVRAGLASVIGKMPASERDNKLISEALAELKILKL